MGDGRQNWKEGDVKCNAGEILVVGPLVAEPERYIEQESLVD